MPKDPKRNLQSYQLRGGHLNEFEFQKRQSEMAESSELPFNDETENPNLAQATRRVAEVVAEAHGIVEKRKKRGVAKTGASKSSAASKSSVKKAPRKSAKKSAKKTTARKATKKRAGL